MSRFIQAAQSTCAEGIERLTCKIESSDPDTPKPEKIKKFWSFIKSIKTDALGITSLGEKGILKTDAKKKPTFVIGNSNLPSHAKATLTPPPPPPPERD